MWSGERPWGPGFYLVGESHSTLNVEETVRVVVIDAVEGVEGLDPSWINLT